MMNADSRISIRTASLLGVILFLGQLLITQWTVKAAGNRDVIDYISFAGTLSSILLAVVAIVYSYYTTTAQKNDADRIATQIGSLGSTISTLNSSEVRLSMDLQKLSDISAKLDEVRHRVEEGGSTWSVMQKTLDEVRAEQQAMREVAKNLAIFEGQKAVAVSEVPISDGENEINISEEHHDNLQCDVNFAARLGRSPTDEQCLLYSAAITNIFSPETIRITISRDVESLALPEMKTKFLSDSAYGEVFGYVMVFIDLGLNIEAAIRDAFLVSFCRTLRKFDPTPKTLPNFNIEEVKKFIGEKVDELEKLIGKPI